MLRKILLLVAAVVLVVIWQRFAFPTATQTADHIANVTIRGEVAPVDLVQTIAHDDQATAAWRRCVILSDTVEEATACNADPWRRTPYREDGKTNWQRILDDAMWCAILLTSLLLAWWLTVFLTRWLVKPDRVI